MNIRLFFAALLLAACPLAVHAQQTPSAPPVVATPPAAATADAVTLRYKFTPGQVRRYQMVMDMNMVMQTAPSAAAMPMTNQMKMIMRQTVKDVRPSDGAATIISEIESMSNTMNGAPMPAETEARLKKPSTLVMTPTGKIISMQIGGLPAGVMPGMDFSKGFINGNYALPENPVQVGQSWNGSAAVGMAGMQMAIHSTLLKLDTSAGSPGIAEVTQNLSGLINNDMGKTSPIPMKMTGNISGTGTQHFDVGAGAIADQDMTMQMAIQMVIGSAGSQASGAVPHTMHMKMQMHMTMDRLPDVPPTP